VKDGQVLECAGISQGIFDDACCLANGFHTLRRDLSDHARRKSRPRKGRTAEDGRGETEGFRHLAHGRLSQLDERFQDIVSVDFLRIDTELGEDVVLPLDPRNSLLDIGEDGALEEMAGAAFADQPAEDVFVKRLGDGLSFLFGIGKSLQRREEFLPRIDKFHRHAERSEEGNNLLRLILAHDAVIDEVGLQPLAERPMSEHRHRGGIHSPRKGVDGESIADVR